MAAKKKPSRASVTRTSKKIAEAKSEVMDLQERLRKERDRDERQAKLRMFCLMPNSQAPVVTQVWAETTRGDPDSIKKGYRGHGWSEVAIVDLPSGASTTPSALEKRVRDARLIMVDGSARFMAAKPVKAIYADLEGEERRLFKGTPTLAKYVEVMGDPPRSTFMQLEFDIASVVVTSTTFAKEVGALTDDMFVLVHHFSGTSTATQAKADAFAKTFRKKYNKWASGSPWEIEINMSRFVMVERQEWLAAYDGPRPRRPSREIEV